MAKYILSRSGYHYYQRRIPKDVAHHYPRSQQTKIVKPLGRVSLGAAAKAVAKLALEDDNLWAAYRGEKSKGEREMRREAATLLERYGLKPGDRHRAEADRDIEVLIDVFYEAEVEPQREKYADGDEERYYKVAPEKYLYPLTLEALRQLHGEDRQGSFAKAPFGYRQFRDAMKALVAKGYLKITKGHFNRYSMFGDKLAQGFGKATRWQATNLFFSICEHHDITPQNVQAHFRLPLPSHPLVLKESSVKSNQFKIRGRAIKYSSTSHSRELEAEVKEINQKLSQHEMGNAGFYGYRRIFGEGDDPTSYEWNKGGRLYCVGDGSYQSIKSELRQLITIDGEPCVELDITANHLTIFHALLHEAFDPNTDPYEIKGLPRIVIKKWVVMALGAGSYPERWSPEAGKDYREDTGRKSLGKDFPIKKIENAIIISIPLLGVFRAHE